MSKVCVIGLDGAGLGFLQEHLEHLPHLQAIARKGMFGVLRSTIPPMTCPAWNCFMTGHPPNVLGIYDWESLELPGGPRLTDWSMRRIPTLWDMVSGAGKNVVAVNVPLTYPPRKVNGAMVSGFPTPRDRQDWVFPLGLRDELARLGISHVQELNPDAFRLRLGGQGKDEFLASLDQSIQKTLDITRHCMAAYRWDLLVTVFVATDRVQHHFWHHVDVNHPRYTPEQPGKYVEAIAKVYARIDQGIGELLTDLDEDTYVIVMSDHGFGPHYGKFLVNSWLMEQGLLKLRPRSARDKGLSAIVPNLRSPTVRQLVRFLDRVGLLAFARRVLPAILGTKGTVLELREAFDSIDLERTKVLGLSNGKLYINSEHDEEKKELTKLIRREVRQLKDPLSGAQLATTVLSREELYGASTSEGPDVYLILDNYKYGTASRITPGRLWEVPTDVSGDHREEGIVLIKGPQVEETPRLETAYIWDLAPTILHALDIPVPQQISGRILREGFEQV